MKLKLTSNVEHPRGYLNPYRHNYQHKKIVLEQTHHLDRVIKVNSISKIHNSTNFQPWAHYHNSNKAQAQLILHAHIGWIKLSELCNIVDYYQSKFVFLAVNKYMLLEEQHENLDDDYDLAIGQIVQKKILQFDIIDYQYHYNERGNIGNFVIPDNRILLCKKQ
jgi:hypothetical protein